MSSNKSRLLTLRLPCQVLAVAERKVGKWSPRPMTVRKYCQDILILQLTRKHGKSKSRGGSK